MPGAHRQDDSRMCGAKTIASDFGVYVNGKLWSVENDPNTHGAGNLVSVTGATVNIGGKKVIVAVGDVAKPDMKKHPIPPTDPVGRSSDVFCYG